MWIEAKDIKKNFNRDLLITILTIHKAQLIRHNNKTPIIWDKDQTLIKTCIIKYWHNKDHLAETQVHNLDKTKEETLDEEEVQVVVSIHQEVDIIIWVKSIKQWTKRGNQAVDKIKKAKMAKLKKNFWKIIKRIKICRIGYYLIKLVDHL